MGICHSADIRPKFYDYNLEIAHEDNSASIT